MKKIVVLLGIFLSGSLIPAASAQYVVTHNGGVSDITSYCTTNTNCFRPLPAKTFASIAMLPDLTFYGIDSVNGCVWSYDAMGTRTYTQQTILGCGWVKVALEEDPTYGFKIGLLKNDTTCPAPSFFLLGWSEYRSLQCRNLHVSN